MMRVCAAWELVALIEALAAALERERWADVQKISNVLLASPIERSFDSVCEAGLGHLALKLSVVADPASVGVVGKQLVVQVDRAAKRGF